MANWQVFELMHVAPSSGMTLVIEVEGTSHDLTPAQAVAAAYGLSADEFERTTVTYARFVAIRPANTDLGLPPTAYYVRRNG